MSERVGRMSGMDQERIGNIKHNGGRAKKKQLEAKLSMVKKRVSEKEPKDKKELWPRKKVGGRQKVDEHLTAVFMSES